MPELMKGHRWRDHKHKMTYPAWAEIKYDEIRVHVVVHPQGPEWPVTFLSFAGKPLFNLERFAAGFRQLAQDTGHTEFDVGFEANSSFNDTYRWVRSKNGVPPELVDAPTRFILFDLPIMAKEDFRTRVTHRHNVCVAAHAEGFTSIELPGGGYVSCADEVDALFTKVRAEGLEGLMVKSWDHLYERGKRSYGWLKVKPEDDADGIITAVNQAVAEDGALHAWAGSVDIKCEDGSVASPHGIPHELGADMVRNPDKYIGQWAEFKFMERDRQGGYRHPTWGRLREAKA